MTQIKSIRKFFLLAATMALPIVGNRPVARAASSVNRVPVLVELYTSEGCSSCPPADAFLQRLDQQPVAGAKMIVLSEHVDYWNHDGWKDPYSSSFYTDRQGAYERRFGLESAYTPQMVVDGTEEFVGSDAAAAQKAFAREIEAVKLAVQLSSISVESNAIQAQVEAGPLPQKSKSDADVYAVLALNHAESRVARGENAGRTLDHTAVVRSITRVGGIRPGQSFSQQINLKLEPVSGPDNLRLVVFVQESHQGRILGAAAAPLVK